MKNDKINVGRRKSSVARVNLKKGSGKIIINNLSPKNYFKRDSLVMMLSQPLELVNYDGKFDFIVNVNGGGLSGQAGAVRLGLSKKLEQINPASRVVLKKAGMLTRDSRVVERKKYGRAKARKSFQFSKR